jgi:large subunit ribosomal protein L32e
VIRITEKERLLKIRAKKNSKRPKFIRAEWHRLKRLQTSWRRPRGIDSKMRKKLKGKRKRPSSGYRNPKDVRGLHASGKEILQVFNVYDLEDVDADNQIVQIGSTVGSRKRTNIINLAEEMDIHIINPQIRRDIDEDIEDEFEFDDDTDTTFDDDDTILLDDVEDLDDEEEA